MTTINKQPDLLHRFVSTPYVFGINCGSQRVDIQSNDLEVALGVRSLCIRRQREEQSTITRWKLIRDGAAPSDADGELIFGHGLIRTLHAGRGTILIYDQERSELLGFVAPNVSARKLVTSLIPTLIGSAPARSDLPAFTNK
jgi:hypothetical protein